jgi:hypothetical protein
LRKAYRARGIGKALARWDELQIAPMNAPRMRTGGGDLHRTHGSHIIGTGVVTVLPCKERRGHDHSAEEQHGEEVRQLTSK